MPTTGLIGFGDADAFYASAEAIRRPWLAKLAVGVLGNQGACVIARNYRMKAAGVKVGEPVWEAKGKCPNGVFLKRDFRWYETVSRRMLAEVKTFSPAVEYFSVDEFFWDGIPLPKRSYQETAEAIRAHIRERVGMPMTVAFARTRTLAKLFADVSKPNGAIAVEDEQRETQLLAAIPVTEIAGIARRRALRLERLGIKTCLDFRRANGRLIKQELTAAVHDLWCEVNGERVTPIRPKRPRHQHIARGGSLAGKVRDSFSLYGWLVRNVERLLEELHYHEVRPSTLTVSVSYFEDDPAAGVVHLDVPSDRFDVLLDAAKVGLRRAWRPGKVATHMHVIASGLRRQDYWQQSLFGVADAEEDPVATVKRQVNERFGRFKLRSGATLFANAFYQDPANLHEICDIREKFCF